MTYDKETDWFPKHNQEYKILNKEKFAQVRKNSNGKGQHQ
jgi:hypothetical protein